MIEGYQNQTLATNVFQSKCELVVIPPSVHRRGASPSGRARQRRSTLRPRGYRPRAKPEPAAPVRLARGVAAAAGATPSAWPQARARNSCVEGGRLLGSGGEVDGVAGHVGLECEVAILAAHGPALEVEIERGGVPFHALDAENALVVRELLAAG